MTSIKADVHLVLTGTNGIQGGRVAITPHVLPLKQVSLQIDNPCDDSGNPNVGVDIPFERRALVYPATKQRAIATSGR